MKDEQGRKQARIARSLDPRALRFERWGTRKEQAEQLIAGYPDEERKSWLARQLERWIGQEDAPA